MKKIAVPDIDSLITTVRGSKVILDSDLAALYQIPTKALNEALKRNAEKFPSDFVLRLTRDEAENLRRSRSQIVTLRGRLPCQRRVHSIPDQAKTRHSMNHQRLPTGSLNTDCEQGLNQ